jgi:hypothetical protein
MITPRTQYIDISRTVEHISGMPNKRTKPVEDYPPTAEQWQISEWLASHKRIPLPPECKQSRLEWWRWLNSQITQIDREDARAASIDFGLALDLENPVSIIGALKYSTIADQSDKLDLAKKSILAGVHPYTAQENYWLSDKELTHVTKDIELRHPEFEIDWGSI